MDRIADVRWEDAGEIVVIKHHHVSTVNEEDTIVVSLIRTQRLEEEVTGEGIIRARMSRRRRRRRSREFHFHPGGIHHVTCWRRQGGGGGGGSPIRRRRRRRDVGGVFSSELLDEGSEAGGSGHHLHGVGDVHYLQRLVLVLGPATSGPNCAPFGRAFLLH